MEVLTQLVEEVDELALCACSDLSKTELYERMSKAVMEVLTQLVEEVDELALCACSDLSRTELYERLDSLMWKVTWAVEDVAELLDEEVAL